MAVIRQNSFDGVDGAAVTEVNSATFGDGFDHTDPTGVTYDADNAYQGVACLRLDDADGSNGVAWQGLALADCAMRVYIKRSAAAESGNLWWTNATGAATIGVGGDLGFGAVSLPDALPADTWCRVEATRSGTTVTLSVWSTNPESVGPPDATGTGTITGATISQWWLEHQGEAVFFDELAVADTATEIGPLNPVVPDPMVITQSCDGPAGEPVTASESGAYGTPWGIADDAVFYTAGSYAGVGGIAFGGGFEDAHGVAWNTGITLDDFAVRGYLRRDGDAESGSVAWANAVGGCLLTAGGGLTWAGLELPAGAVPAEQWVRVEWTRAGTTGHLAVYADPQSLTPSASTSGQVSNTPVRQWWWERYGPGSIVWDELALSDTATPLGPITMATSESLFLPPGLLPMFAT